MAKNAAEATPENGSVKIGYMKKNEMALFSVNNPGNIPVDVRLQIFQRSYSTKGRGRGLGTYSMKLFGETVLKGKVYFTSDEKSGTTFTIELPITS
jgi:sensor histidine kinase regulating citrate/malate metabolism